MMMESSDEESDGSPPKLPTTQSDSVATASKDARAESPARKVNPQDTTSAIPVEVEHFATLLALTDIDRKKSAHMTNIRRQRKFMNGQLPAIAQAKSVDTDTKLLHAVLKTLSTMSGISVANEDMASTTSVGLFACRAMRAYALAYDKDPIKPQVQLKAGLDQDQLSKLKMVQNVLQTMLS